jgi:hypothetical protein
VATRVLVASGALLLVLLLVVAFDVVTARNSLETARSSLLQARDVLAAGDLATARTRVDAAAAAADRADARTSGPHWTLLRSTPVIGDDVRTARAVTETVGSATTLAQDAMDVVAEVIDDEGNLPELTDDGTLDLGPIRTLERGLAQLDFAPLEQDHDALFASDDQPRLNAIEDARAETVAAAADAMELLQRGRDATRLATSMLGADDPRRYLVMVQNNGELRGTGGIIGFLAVLDVQGGALQLSDPEGVNPEAVVDDAELIVRGRFSERDALDSPVDRPDDFADRYDAIAAGAFLASTNADPDLPTVAPIVLDLYEQRAGQRLDGVIAIDPLALQRIQAAVGPLELSSEVRDLAPNLPHPIPPERLASTLLIDVYDALGGPTDERRLYQTAVAEASLSSVLGGDWEATAVAEAVAGSFTTRHIQVYTRDAEAQEAALRLGAAGELAPARAGDDLLAITANNAAGNKMDVHVSHRTVADVQLDVPRVSGGEVFVRRDVTSRVEIRNTVDVDAATATSSTPTSPSRSARPWRPTRDLASPGRG